MWFARLACRIRDAMSALSLVRSGAWHRPGVLTGSRRTLWGLMAPVFDVEVAVIRKMGDEKRPKFKSVAHASSNCIFESMSGLRSDLDGAFKIKHVHQLAADRRGNPFWNVRG